MHFDRNLLNVEFFFSPFFFFTVSVNVLCLHVTYGRECKGAFQLLLLAATCYGSDIITKTAKTAIGEQSQDSVEEFKLFISG